MGQTPPVPFVMFSFRQLDNRQLCAGKRSFKQFKLRPNEPRHSAKQAGELCAKNVDPKIPNENVARLPTFTSLAPSNPTILKALPTSFLIKMKPIKWKCRAKKWKRKERERERNARMKKRKKNILEKIPFCSCTNFGSIRNKRPRSDLLRWFNFF